MSNIKEQIRQEIERRREANKRQYLSSSGDMSWQRMCGEEDCLVELLAFIDSLPEEKPSEDLEEEVKRYYSDNFTYISSDQPTLSILTNVARHFAEWQKEQMMKDAVEGDYDCQYMTPAVFLDKYLDGIKDGDKVRIIIVKED